MKSFSSSHPLAVYLYSRALAVMSTGARHPWGIPLLAFLAIVLPQLADHLPFAQDDLLRNVVAYAWGYDYRSLYPGVPGIPPFDPYLGFDGALGLVSRVASPRVSVHLAQLMGTVALIVAMLRPLADKPDSGFRICFVLFSALSSLVTARLVSGRPEILATAWLLSAATVPLRTWLVLGLLLSPTYWLWPLYSVGAFLLKGTFRDKLLGAVAAGLSTSLFWALYARLDWAIALRGLLTISDRHGIVSVEALPLTSLLGYPGTWLVLSALVGTVLWQRSRLQAPQWWLAAALFLAIGSARHILVLAPLALIWVALQPWPRATLSHWSALSLLAIACGVCCMQQFPEDSGPSFVLPPGSTVLSGYSKAVFYLPFYNPGSIQLVPSIEPAWDSPQSRELASATTKGTLRCEQLTGTEISHVVTTETVTLKGACFKKTGSQKTWSLWEVRKELGAG